MSLDNPQMATPVAMMTLDEVEAELAMAQDAFGKLDGQLMQGLAQIEVMRMNMTGILIRCNDLRNRKHELGGVRIQLLHPVGRG